ncbi:MAG: SurA N-terminal domain-containing protein [Ectothiorhodospiraceae bacterium]|nr:SurA N-terminal domain-containing protein [Ectothiorhodospiraceae bacterium]
MLQQIRDRATGIIAWIIVILIVIPFALWGIQDYVSPDATVVVARVNDEEVPLQAFQNAYQRQRQQLRALFGAAADTVDDELLRKRTVDQLVNDQLLLQAAADGKMRVGDAQLVEAVRSQPSFQREGAFAVELYEQALRSQGYTSLGFEEELRRSLLLEQFREAAGGATVVTAPEVERFSNLARETRAFRSLRLAAADHRDYQPSDADITAHFERNRDRFVTAEQVKLQYVEISRAALASGVEVADEELRRRYEERKENYRTAEQRRASHILLSVPQDADEAAVSAARGKLAEVEAALAAGGDFAELAKTNSEDPGTAGQGGDLGWFGRGVMDPEFENAAFTLAEGVVSEPVRSRFGLHLIKVTGIRPSVTRSFEEVRDVLVAEYRNEQAERMYVDQAERLATIAFEQSDNLEGAADALGVPLQETDLIGRDATLNGLGVGSEPGVIQAAFTPEVLEEGHNSDLVELEGGRAVVVRVLEHKPARPQTLDEVRDVVVAELVDEHARDAARELGEKLVGRLRGGESPETVASEAGAQWTEAQTVTRETSLPSRELVEAVFRMPRPTGDGPGFDGTAVDGGDYALIRLDSVAVPAAADGAQERATAIRARLSAELGRAEFDAMIKAMRAGSEVVVYDDRVQ